MEVSLDLTLALSPSLSSSVPRGLPFRGNDLPTAPPADLCDPAPMSEPWGEMMEVSSDPALAPSRSLLSSVPRGLPFPGGLVDE
jgi:hypothetical protein